MVANLNRNDLLKYKVKNRISFDESIFSYFHFDLNLVNSSQIILSSAFNNLKKKYILLENLNQKTFFKMQPSLGSIFIHNIFSFNFYSNTDSYKFYKCNNIYCKICPLSTDIKVLPLNKKLKFPIACSSDCSTSNFIQVIKCKKCRAFYIGQSYRTVRERLNEHIYNINNFIPFIKNISSTSIHFNLLNHSLNDFNFCILYKDIFDDDLRRHVEAKLIELFKNTLNLKVMNRETPSIYKNIYKIMV